MFQQTDQDFNATMIGIFRYLKEKIVKMSGYVQMSEWIYLKMAILDIKVYRTYKIKSSGQD